jgi:hypothetical protein
MKTNMLYIIGSQVNEYTKNALLEFGLLIKNE